MPCNASLKGLGCCLIQAGITAYLSYKSLTETESRYSDMEREMLGVLFHTGPIKRNLVTTML